MKITSDIFAYPTESFFALGVDATDPKAIQQLFRVKHREQGKPVALIAADIMQVKKFFYMSSLELRLARKYWPGPVTILLRPKKKIAADALFMTTPSRPLGRATPPELRRGEIRIGVRVPRHSGARRLAKTLGVPITATSANISGQPPTKSADKVKRDFPDILVMLGRCGRQHLPSTVIEIQHSTINIIRQGSVTIF